MKRRWARITRPLREDFSLKGFARMTRPYRMTARDRKTAADRAALKASGPSLASVDHARLTSLEGRVERLQAGWNQHVPGLIDSVTLALSEARAADRVHARIDALREDMDRLSKRLDLGLMDVRARQHAPALGQSGAADAQIVSIGTLAEALAGELRLQFVHHDTPVPGYLVVSRYATPGVDVIAPTGVLPFGGDRAKNIIVEAGYDLGDDLVAVFAGWFALLAPGGRIAIHRIDMLDLVEALADGSLTFDDARAHLSTDRKTSSPAGPPAAEIKAAAAVAGFVEVRVVRTGGGMGFTVQARRPAAKS